MPLVMQTGNELQHLQACQHARDHRTNCLSKTRFSCRHDLTFAAALVNGALLGFRKHGTILSGTFCAYNHRDDSDYALADAQRSALSSFAFQAENITWKCHRQACERVKRSVSKHITQVFVTLYQDLHAPMPRLVLGVCANKQDCGNCGKYESMYPEIKITALPPAIVGEIYGVIRSTLAKSNVLVPNNAFPAPQDDADPFPALPSSAGSGPMCTLGNVEWPRRPTDESFSSEAPGVEPHPDVLETLETAAKQEDWQPSTQSGLTHMFHARDPEQTSQTTEQQDAWAAYHQQQQQFPRVQNELHANAPVFVPLAAPQYPFHPPAETYTPCTDISRMVCSAIATPPISRNVVPCFCSTSFNVEQGQNCQVFPLSAASFRYACSDCGATWPLDQNTSPLALVTRQMPTPWNATPPSRVCICIPKTMVSCMTNGCPRSFYQTQIVDMPTVASYVAALC